MSKKVIILVIIAIIFVISSFFFIPFTFLKNQPYLCVDFPCATKPYNISPRDNIQISISIFPREAISGGGCITKKSEDNYLQIKLPELGPSRMMIRAETDWIPVDLFVQGESIIIDNIILTPNESYIRSYLYQSINPWEMYTINLFLQNQGRIMNEGNILFIYGEISEGWIISPIGIIIFLSGIIIFVRIYFMEKGKKRNWPNKRLHPIWPSALSLRLDSLRCSDVYWEPSPAQPAKRVSRRSLGAYR